MCLRKPFISCITTYNFLITNIKQKPGLRSHFKPQGSNPPKKKH